MADNRRVADGSTNASIQQAGPTITNQEPNPCHNPARTNHQRLVPTKRHPLPARKALQDLAAPALNQRYQTPAPSSPLKPLSEQQLKSDYHISDDGRSTKRRKVQHHTPESSPCRPPPLSDFETPKSSPFNGPARERVLLSPIRSLNSSQELLGSDEDCSDDDLITGQQPVKRITPLTSRGLAGQLMQRQSGAGPIRFTAALTAVGDEEGRIRLLDSSGDVSHPFSDIHLTFQAHPNAIIDVAFSDDDYLLATASGDQTGRVIDMMTQTPIAVLQHHTASLKQVRFQPGKANSSVLATSSRDGSVQIWDLRCFGGPVQDIAPPQGRQSTLGFRRPQPKHGCAVNSLYNAHARTQRQTQQAFTIGPGDTPSRGELPGRIGDVSVTALQFLPPGREFLLLTACESDASVKLWDVRSIHTSRQKTPSPLSVTAPPASHSNWRPFGTSSLALNTDGSRLYAVCKDNTVYAYSTAHLMLGHAPELSTRNGEPARRRYGAVTQQGLGPLYGFRHPLFHAASFYVKCAVRPAREGQSELLAVGSSDNRAILFPTDERYFANNLATSMGALSLENSTIATATNPYPMSDHLGGARRPLFGRNSRSSANLASFSASNSDSDIPIVRNAGTPLVRGHDREVGAVAWTAEGKLVTVGDDFSIRCWAEDRERAADLRTGGETGGRRWGCGWADVGDDWDVSDDDNGDEC
ncbi:hypothetical protein DL771_007802 [Monosporascus sp. 5C6A]|nr:hypothetical protein DL771_007802 [Monosporascus sp. 5C6A]